MPFLSEATGDPQNLKRRLAMQAARGVPADEARALDFRSNGGPVVFERSEIERQIISPSGEPEANLVGKRNISGGPFAIGDVDPSNRGYLMMVLNVLRKYTYAALTGYNRWRIGTAEEDDADPYLTYWEDNDVIPRFRMKDVLCGGYTTGATPNGNFAAQFPFVAGEYDFHGAGVQTEAGTAVAGLAITSITRVGSVATVTTTAPHGLTTGDVARIAGAVETAYNGDVTVTVTGASTFTYAVTGTPATPATGTITYDELTASLPILSNTWSGNWADDDEDKSISVKVTAVAGDVHTLQAKVNDAESYSASFDVKAGYDSAGEPIFVRVPDQDGLAIGTWAEQVRIHLPEGGTFPVGAEWRWDKRREAWLQILDAERPISSVETAFFLSNDDGDLEEIRIPGGVQVAVAYARNERLPDTPGRQGASVDRGGKLTYVVTPTRRITDLRLQKALHEGQTVAVVLDSKTSVDIGTSGKPYRDLRVLPACQVWGPGFSVAAGGNNKDESPTLRASRPEDPFTYDGMVFSSAYTHVIETDITESEVFG